MITKQALGFYGHLLSVTHKFESGDFREPSKDKQEAVNKLLSDTELELKTMLEQVGFLVNIGKSNRLTKRESKKLLEIAIDINKSIQHFGETVQNLSVNIDCMAIEHEKAGKNGIIVSLNKLFRRLDK